MFRRTGELGSPTSGGPALIHAHVLASHNASLADYLLYGLHWTVPVRDMEALNLTMLLKGRVSEQLIHCGAASALKQLCSSQQQQLSI